MNENGGLRAEVLESVPPESAYPRQPEFSEMMGKEWNGPIAWTL